MDFGDLPFTSIDIQKYSSKLIDQLNYDNITYTMDYETFIRKLDRDVEDLEQLRRTPLLVGCDDWDQEVHHLKSVRDFLNVIKNTEDESEQLQAMTGRFFKKE